MRRTLKLIGCSTAHRQFVQASSEASWPNAHAGQVQRLRNSNIWRLFGHSSRATVRVRAGGCCRVLASPPAPFLNELKLRTVSNAVPHSVSNYSRFLCWLFGYRECVRCRACSTASSCVPPVATLCRRCSDLAVRDAYTYVVQGINVHFGNQ